MSQQPAEVCAHDALDAGNREDLLWIFEEITRLPRHEPGTCALCDRHSDHFRETGMVPSSASFRDARRLEEGQTLIPLLSTFKGLDALCKDWEAMANNYAREVNEAARELETIKRENREVSREYDRLSQKLKEEREEVARFRQAEARVMDEVSRLTGHAPQSHHSQPAQRREDAGHTQIPPAQSAQTNNLDSDSDSVVEITPPPM
jgi:myosin heavy subunit